MWPCHECGISRGYLQTDLMAGEIILWEFVSRLFSQKSTMTRLIRSRGWVSRFPPQVATTKKVRNSFAFWACRFGVKETYGKNIAHQQSGQGQQIPESSLPSLPSVRTPTRLPAQVQPLSDLFPGHGLDGGDRRGHHSQ